nr:reverse transcriptase domain-containing protein [Tanacetum cinerariifolium]
MPRWENDPGKLGAAPDSVKELLRAPTEGYAEAIVVPLILADQFELKHSLINMMTTDQFFELEKDNPHDHIRWGARRWLEKEPPRSIHTWEDLVSKFINEFFPPQEQKISVMKSLIFNDGLMNRFTRHEIDTKSPSCMPSSCFTELHQFDTFYNALNLADQDSLNAAAGGNLLERRTQDVLTIIKNKSKVHNSQNKSVVSQVKSCDANSNSSLEIAKLTHVVNQQTSAVTTAMTAILKQFQATPPPASVKAIEEICVTCGVNYNQGNSVYRPSEQSYQAPTQQNQIVPLNELEKVKRMNEANMKAMQTQINMVKNEMKNSIQASLSNQTNEIKNMMASLLQMNTASTSGAGSLPSNTVPNPKEDERVDETLTDPDLAEYTIKVPPPPLHINITLADALILMPKYQIMLKALLSNKEKLQELANTPLNKNCSAIILKRLPEKLRDPGKFLIPCGFSELKCKALANKGSSINLMPLSVWKKLGLPELISTRMTLELANRAICTSAGIVRDVFVPVDKFTFPPDFFIVDYESDPKVPLSWEHL